MRQPPIQQLDATPVELGYRIADMLPDDAAERLRGELRGLGPQIVQQLRLYRRTLAGAGDLLKAETVDRAALKSVIDEARAYRAKVGDLLTDVFVETAAELPIETRKKLLSRFRLRLDQ
jgi:uncharacterized membrane protein